MPSLLALALACASRPGPVAASTVGEIETHGVVTCAAPEVRAASPLHTPDWGPDWAAQPTSTDHAFGAGVAVADLTGDGRPDIFLPEETQDRLYVQAEDGSFVDETATRLPSDEGDGECVSAADYDGDGDLDLYVGNRGPNRLLRNDDGVFAVADAGVEDGDHYTAGSAWADIDGDDDLDLLVLNHAVAGIDIEAVQADEMSPGDPNGLYRNEGDGTFTAISDTLPGGARYGYSFAGGFPDLDADLDPDLYVVNDFGSVYEPNVALWNDGGALTEADVGLDVKLYGMGLGVGDLNDDLLPDFLVPSWDEVDLLISSEHGLWYDEALARGLVVDGERHVGWGGNLVDLDNDGDLDALASFGRLWLPPEEAAMWESYGLYNPEVQPDALWLAEDGTFTEVGESWGLDQDGAGRGTAVYDIDGDGFLDLVKRALNEPALGFVANCDDNAWLQVELAQEGMNRFAVGARVIVETQDARRVRWIHAGSRDLSTGTGPAEHFGLADAEEATITVDWPDGARSLFEGVTTRQRVTVQR